jgi:hypothetical protein
MYYIIMMNINEKWLQYLLFFLLFILSQSLSMWGQYVTLPFKNLSMWEAYKMAMPFAWLAWIFMTFTIMVGHKYNLATPTQNIFLLIIIQFSLILIINQVYLKQPITKSDIISFIFILFGFFVSFFHLTTRFLGISTNNEKMPKNITEKIEEIEDVV